MSSRARIGLALLLFSAEFLFMRGYMLINKSYLNLALYLAGGERLPYQRRLLPMLLLRGLQPVPVSHVLLDHSRMFHHMDWVYLFCINLLALAAATYFCVRLYRAASPSNRLTLAVYPVFLYTLAWTYLIHIAGDYYYPYDMLSLAFFSAGLFFVYTQRFLPLLAVMFLGTFNRETTVFLVPLFLLNAVAVPRLSLRNIAWGRIPWVKAACLGLTWLAIRLFLARFYKTNDASESHLRIIYNLRYLPPKNWPQMLGGCGFLMPVLWCLRRRIPDARMAAYIYILPLWVAVMYCWGVLIETRIYGELCPLVTVASLLLLEAYVDDHRTPATAT